MKKLLLSHSLRGKAEAIFLVILILSFTNNLFPQTVGIGTNTPNNSSLLDIKSNTKGLLIPRTSTISRTTIANPAKGLMLYDTTTSSFWYYNDTAWIEKGRIELGSENTFLGYESGMNPYAGAVNTAIGFQSLSLNNTGNGNTATGAMSMSNNSSGNYNTANGYQSLNDNTTGYENTATGSKAMLNNTSGYYNTATGADALNANQSGYSNVAIGYQAMTGNNSGYNNVAMGRSALISNQTGHTNIAIGPQAMLFNSTGHYSIGIGDSSLYHYNSSDPTSNNIAIGSKTMFGTTTGKWNTAVGQQSLYINATGGSNTAIGYNALYQGINSSNTAIGYQALYYTTAGNNNTALGVFAVCDAAGNQNTMIGSNATVFSVSAANNSTAIGYNATAAVSNKIRLGNNLITVIEGQVGFSSVSDRRFKFNISEDGVKGLDFIQRLRPVTYQFDINKMEDFQQKGLVNATHQPASKEDMAAASSIIRTGFIAQEVEQAAKESGYQFDGLHRPENERDNYSLVYSQFVIPLVKAVQEQQKMISTLKDENEELKKEIKLIKEKIGL